MQKPIAILVLALALLGGKKLPKTPDNPLDCLEHDATNDRWGKAKISVIGQSRDNKLVAIKETIWLENTGDTIVTCKIKDVTSGKDVHKTAYRLPWEKPPVQEWEAAIDKNAIAPAQWQDIPTKQVGKRIEFTHEAKPWTATLRIYDQNLRIEVSDDSMVGKSHELPIGAFQPELVKLYSHKAQLLFLVSIKVSGKGTTVNEQHIVDILRRKSTD